MDDITVTPGEVRQARAFVAAHSQDADEERELLETLGLMDPETEQTLYERV